MADLIKEALVLIIVLFAVMPFSYGLSINCGLTSPPSGTFVDVTNGGRYYIKVDELSASQVGYGTSPFDAVMHFGTSYIFSVDAPASETTITWLGLGKDSVGNWILDSGATCQVNVKCSGTTNSNPSVSISANPSSVSSGGITTITVSGSDVEGLNFIQYYDGANYYAYQCNDAKTCSNSWSGITMNQNTVFTGYSQDLCGLTAQASTTVTVTNSPPYFITTSPLPDATKNVLYTTTIQATDPDGDIINYNLVEGSIYGMSISSSTGILSWPIPDSTKTIRVGISDGINPRFDQPFTLPVQSCTNGQTRLCTKKVGVCSGSLETCSGGIWPGCTDAAYSAYAISQGKTYQSIETLCDGLDNDCDGTTADEVCVFGCIDNDGDKFNQSATNCGPADCDDDKSNDPIGCPATKTGCKESTSKCAICINENAVEYCDFIDNNCDGQTDGSNVCTCEKLLGLGKTGKARISYPADNANFFAGESVSFVAEKDALVDAYSWEFGNSQTDVNDKGGSSTIYVSKGDYTVKLKTIDESHCEDIASIIIHINPCQKKEDCENNQICQNDLCKKNETVQATTTVKEEPLIITINSPSNQVYGQNTVPLVFSTSKPSQCSYGLNNGNLIAIQQNTKSITGKEGLNNLILKCSNASSSVQFTITTKTEQESILQDLKGEGSGESLLSFAKERGQEMKLTKEQAKDVISEVMEVSGLEITKSIEVSGSSSLVMLSIKNILPMTLENARIKITIPKTIAKTAAEIKAIDQFTVIDNDPMIQFILNMARNQQQTLTFEVNKVMDQAMLDQISITTEEDISSLLKKQQDTADAMKITKQFEEFQKDGEIYTRITTRINPKKGLKGMSLIEKIPKCLAKQIDYIKMDDKYRSMIKVINPDPIIMWQFQEITKEDTFSYEVKGILSEECKNQIRSLGIADELGLDIEQTDYFRIILPLLLVPLLGIGFVYFHRFSERREKELEEKEKPKKEEKKEKPKEEKKEEKDVGKFLDREIEEAEREFGKRVR